MRQEKWEEEHYPPGMKTGRQASSVEVMQTTAPRGKEPRMKAVHTHGKYYRKALGEAWQRMDSEWVSSITFHTQCSIGNLLGKAKIMKS